MRAAMLPALWGAVCWSGVLASYSASEERDHPIRDDAEHVDAVLGDAVAGMVWVEGESEEVNEEFLLYSQRVYRRVRLGEVDAGDGRWLITDARPALEGALREAGYREVMRFEQDVGRESALYRPGG